MPADRVPEYETPLTLANGKTNPVFWRFWARIAAQFSGKDAPVMPVNVPGLLSITNAQGRPPALTEAAVIEAAKQLLRTIPSAASADLVARDLATIAGASRKVADPEPGALDLAMMANARIRPAAPTPPQIIVCTQATFPTLANFGPVFVYVSDFAHWIYWDGTTASFADGGSDYYVVAPAAPSAIGWHAVDGSTVNYLNADGTLTAKILVDVAGTPAYLKVGAGGDTLNAPVAPTISGHTESATTGITVSAASPAAAASVSGTHGAATGTDFTAVTAINGGGGGGGGGAVTDPGHTHNLLAADAPISTTGEPENFYSKLWFRL